MNLVPLIVFFSAIGVGAKFHKDFHLQMMRIQSNPFQFQVCYGDIRIVQLNDFNYSIHYNVVNKTITVLRILNQHQSYCYANIHRSAPQNKHG